MSLLTGDDFGQLFRPFEHTAFRLEARDRYNESYENESLQKFFAGEDDELSWMQDWLKMVRTAISEGKRFARVRLVTLPLSDYSRFGVWCAQFLPPNKTSGAQSAAKRLRPSMTRAG